MHEHEYPEPDQRRLRIADAITALGRIRDTSAEHGYAVSYLAEPVTVSAPLMGHDCRLQVRALRYRWSWSAGPGPELAELDYYAGPAGWHPIDKVTAVHIEPAPAPHDIAAGYRGPFAGPDA